MVALLIQRFRTATTFLVTNYLELVWVHFHSSKL